MFVTSWDIAISPGAVLSTGLGRATPDPVMRRLIARRPYLRPEQRRHANRVPWVKLSPLGLWVNRRGH